MITVQDDNEETRAGERRWDEVSAEQLFDSFNKKCVWVNMRFSGGLIEVVASSADLASDEMK